MGERKFPELTPVMMQAIDHLREGAMVAHYPQGCRIVDKFFNPVVKLKPKYFEKLKPGLRKNKWGWYELLPEVQLLNQQNIGFILYHIRKKFTENERATNTNNAEDTIAGTQRG